MTPTTSLWSRRGNVTVARRLALEDGSVRVDQRFDVAARHVATLVSGRHWLWALARVDDGEVRIGGRVFTATPGAPVTFGLVLSPGGIATIELRRGVVTTHGWLSVASPMVPSACSTAANWTALVAPFAPAPSAAAARSILATAMAKMPVAARNVGAGVAALKRALDGGPSRDEPTTIGELARAQGRSRENLTRAFSAAYGVSPARYRVLTRVMNAVALLAHGRAAAAAGLAVGFGDVGRFYQQFRRFAAATPGAYRRAVTKRQDPPAPL
jgi:AraC-like DNA-binding protein